MRVKKLLAAILAGSMIFGSAAEVFAGSNTSVGIQTSDEVTTGFLSAGETKASNATVLTLGESVTGSLVTGETAIYEFTPEADGVYVFESESDYDMNGTLYDSNGKELAHNDDDGEGHNFSIEGVLTAGENYYLYVTEYYGNPVEEFAVSVNVYTGVC